jgi:hypothetical protein
MSKTNDGGPACPVNDVGVNGAFGMTLRDFFAAKADQPTVQEIVTAAGLHSPDNYTVWSDGETQIGTVIQWWGTLTNESRFALLAKVRFQYADAMLAERGK